ncbi:hypothetical protein [Actinacidiphila rubida]|uniref:DNA primase/polymerase bifunctional N-terminal domain-containing protein n=1 Tax=Actinacidiphila rubida TaxID=310780 RepID=A0A1H8QM57_9ACTN|nr:hypothetical protein [Actinacidiphila rubida]SEO55272.1 hypothetical protein SAMN05216267_103071 [Actinacidiphila rubida]
MRWLLTAVTSPARTREHWAAGQVALMPCGDLFGAVRLDVDLLHAAAGTAEWPDVGDYMRRELGGGPVLAHPRSRHLYALISPAATRRWKDDGGAEALGGGTYLGVPSPERIEPEGLHAYWLVPLRRPGALVGTTALTRFLTDARSAQARAARQVSDGGARRA